MDGDDPDGTAGGSGSVSAVPSPGPPAATLAAMATVSGRDQGGAEGPSSPTPAAAAGGTDSEEPARAAAGSSKVEQLIQTMRDNPGGVQRKDIDWAEWYRTTQDQHHLYEVGIVDGYLSIIEHHPVDSEMWRLLCKALEEVQELRLAQYEDQELVPPLFYCDFDNHNEHHKKLRRDLTAMTLEDLKTKVREIKKNRRLGPQTNNKKWLIATIWEKTSEAYRNQSDRNQSAVADTAAGSAPEPAATEPAATETAVADTAAGSAPAAPAEAVADTAAGSAPAAATKKRKRSDSGGTDTSEAGGAAGSESPGQDAASGGGLNTASGVDLDTVSGMENEESAQGSSSPSSDEGVVLPANWGAGLQTRARRQDPPEVASRDRLQLEKRLHSSELKTQRDRHDGIVQQKDNELKQKDNEIKKLRQNLADAKSASSSDALAVVSAAPEDDDGALAKYCAEPPNYFDDDGHTELFKMILRFRTGPKPGAATFQVKLTDIHTLLSCDPVTASLRDYCTRFTPLMLACCYKVTDLQHHDGVSTGAIGLRDEIDPELVKVLLSHPSVCATVDQTWGAPANPPAKKRRKSRAAAAKKAEEVQGFRGDAMYLAIFGVSPFPAGTGKDGPPYVNTKCLEVVQRLLGAEAVPHEVTVRTVNEIAPKKWDTWEPCTKNFKHHLRAYLQGDVPIPKHIPDQRPHAKDIRERHEQLRRMQAIQRAMMIFRIQDIKHVPTSQSAVRGLALPSGRSKKEGKMARDILNDAKEFIVEWREQLQREQLRQREQLQREQDQQGHAAPAGGSAAAGALEALEDRPAAPAASGGDRSAADAAQSFLPKIQAGTAGEKKSVKQKSKGQNCEECQRPWRTILRTPQGSTPQSKVANPGRQLYLNREYLNREYLKKGKPFDEKLLKNRKFRCGNGAKLSTYDLTAEEQEKAGSPKPGTQGPDGNTNPYLCPDCWHKFLGEWRSKFVEGGGGGEAEEEEEEEEAEEEAEEEEAEEEAEEGGGGRNG